MLLFILLIIDDLWADQRMHNYRNRIINYGSMNQHCIRQYSTNNAAAIDEYYPINIKSDKWFDDFISLRIRLQKSVPHI